MQKSNSCVSKIRLTNPSLQEILICNNEAFCDMESEIQESQFSKLFWSWARLKKREDGLNSVNYELKPERYPTLTRDF